jgi:glycosyltransferase involved in cell wall biosynthesis
MRCSGVSVQPDVLHVIGTLGAGGAEQFVVDLLCELASSDVSASLAVLGGRSDPVGEQMGERLRAAGVGAFVSPTPRIRVRSVLWYASLLRRLRPKLVHLHNVNTETAHWIAARLSARRVPMVRTVHNTVIDPNGNHAAFMRRNRAERSIFCGQASLESLRGEIKGPSQRIRYWRRFTWPIRDPEVTRVARERLGFGPQETHYLHIGAFKKQKAHDVLIRAWHESTLGEFGGILHLLGDGALRRSAEDLARGDSSIIFHGIQPNTWTWLLAADCFALPSRHEGLPIAGIEAVATGLPCVFTKIAPLEELDPLPAWWSLVDDVQGLARNLWSFYEERPVANPHGVRCARERFGIERVAKDYAQVYREVFASC